MRCEAVLTNESLGFVISARNGSGVLAASRSSALAVVSEKKIGQRKMHGGSGDIENSGTDI
jgi:hypothetical protein